MSSTPTKQIDGDVAIGRDLTLGGKVTARGSAQIGGNLKVNGWLDAPNVKGPNKGLFKDAVQLREAYPTPHEGWWALVGNTLPAQVYMADGGAWVAQTNADGTPKLAGNPTVDSTEYMEAVEQMTGDLEAVKIDVNQNEEDIKSLRSTQTSQTEQISDLRGSITSNKTATDAEISSVKGRVTKNEEDIKSLQDSKGMPNGVASLDASGKVPASQLPGFVDDVIEFNAMVEDVQIYTADGEKKKSGKKSTDAGCMVVYNKATNTFLLAVTNRNLLVDGDWNDIRRPLYSVRPMAELDVETAPTTRYEFGDFWTTDKEGMIMLDTTAFNYYFDWEDATDFGERDANGIVPESGKVFISTSDNKTFRWSGTALVAIGSDLALGRTASTAFPGDAGAKLESNVDDLQNDVVDLQDIVTDVGNRIGRVSGGVAIYPFNGEVVEGAESADIPESGIYLTTRDNGATSFFVARDWGIYESSLYNTSFHGFLTAREDVIFRNGSRLYRCKNGKLEELGEDLDKPFFNGNKLLNSTSTFTIGEITKLIVERFGTTYCIPGMVLTYKGSKGWESKMWDGEGSYTEDGSWTDFGANGSTIGNTINVNALCGDTDYTLSLAIKAVLDEEAKSGLKYFKSGVVLTYRTSEKDTKGNPVWEAFQYTRAVNDISASDDRPWIPFGGGGGTNLEAKDEPAAGGADAFSTGGAYKSLPTKNKVTQEDGTVTIQLLNEAEEEVGEPIQFMASTGGGGESSGTIVSIVFEQSPLAGAVGKDITGRACIRSITQVGGKEQLNGITSLRLVDRESKLTVREWTVNQASSDEDVYDFIVEFGSYFEGAASRKFQLIATDDTDHEGQRNITVTAVDTTIQCTQSEQVLNYSSDYAIPYGGTKAVSIPLYKFPQNVSEKGIQAFIEVYYKGEWRPLTATPPTHLDAYTNSAQFNPSNLFGGGEKMEHGAYPVRIYGKDVASGVKGNTIYTAVMCIDPTSNVPVVALRYNDTSEGTVKLYDRIKVEVAAYNPQSLTTNVEVKADDKVIGRSEVGQTTVFSTDMQVAGYESGDKINLYAEAYQGDAVLATSGKVSLTIHGSAIDASLMSGALYHMDFSGRSNSEPTHEIEDEGFNVQLSGANWSSNGFVKYLGQNSLRIAENVKGELNHSPFASRTLEDTGMVWQCMFATNNIKDENAMLLHCYNADAGAGFYIKGNKVGMTCKSGSPAKIERRFPCGEIHTMAVVVEPSSISINRNGTDWCTMRLYVDGELIGAVGYNPGGSRLLNTNNIVMDGTEGDLYLYYMLAYNSYYDWSQAFRNYIVKLPDTDAMIEEFNKENVLVSQNAEGSTSMRPSAPLMFAKGMPYCVFVADNEVFDVFDFGKGADDNGTSTSDKFTMTVFYYDPVRPWRSFKAIGCEIRRQGTTSAKRPKKNYRIYIKKATEVIPLYADYTNEDALTTYKLFAMKKIRVGVNTIPVDVITIKVDYSNSGGANDSSVCDMVNATYRSMGDEFLTPAQRCFDGTWDKGDVHLTGLEMNHSTANHPIAVFRSTSDTLQNVYFEAKGNWKEDKGEQVALGFKDTPGYNKGCLNYQDEVFTEIFGVQGESLDQLEARFKTMENLDTEKLYLLSMYCGRNYRFMRYQNGAWTDTTGSWIWQNGKPVITGDVLNPVGGFELLTYEQLDWWQGVSSVADMMAPSKNVASWVKKLITDKPKLGVTGEEFPAWTYFFECMVDNDQLQADLAMGRKVPYELYVQLRLCDYCDYDKHEDWVERFKKNAWKFRNVRADMVYLGDADYQNEFDSLSKNHQPMHFLLEGMNVIKGVYMPTRSDAKALDGINGEFTLAQQPIVQQANKKYDIDGTYMGDNDGGDTGEPEADPTKPSDEAAGYINPWAGWGAVPWRAYFASDVIYVDDTNTIEYKKIVAGMRSCTTTLTDGRKINPFSPDGAKYYFIESRLQQWPKVVSSYDGIRKYIKYTATSDALYFYALQGLGLTALSQFIDQRWRYRDGYYKTGGFFTGVLSGRIACASDAYIRIVAAKSGYYGMGNDSSGSLSADGAVYLEEGQEYIFRNFSHQQGALLYIYQADRIREIEFKGVSLSENFDFGVMKLAEKIIVGGEDYVQYNIGYNPLTAFKLGDLPFLRYLDLRNTPAENVDASKCPRLETLLAGGSALTEFDLAETSPVSTLELPASVTQLNLVNLPRLTYPGGLTIAGMQNVTRLMLSGCEFVDPMALINGIIVSSSLRYVRLPNVNITAPSSILTALRNSGAVGLDGNGEAYQESGRCSGITGRWIMEDLIEESVLADLAAYFPELEVINSQFSVVVCNDIISGDYCERYSNPENQTGADYNKTFVPSGHTLKIMEGTHAYKCTFNSKLNQMEGVQLSDTDFNYLNNGESFDVADTAGEGFDIFHHLPHHWYKGVNDYKTQRKYYIPSVCDNEPLSTASVRVIKSLRDLLYRENTGIYANEAEIGATIDEEVIAMASNTNAYRMDVEGMKQVRWPGIKHDKLGAVFTDADGKILAKETLYVSHTYFDFAPGNYIFTNVPSGAKWIFFTTSREVDMEAQAMAVDSSHIEAIEPEWTEHTVGENDSLVGTYPITIDGMGMPRSVSGAVRSKKGNGTSTTSSQWAYDSDGNPTETPSTLNYTAKDFQNLTRRRGPGYQLQDYEQHKEISNLWWNLHGTTNEQSVVGMGAHDSTLNSRDTIGMADTDYVSGMNSLLGLKHYVGNDSEWMDYIACNVQSYEQFYKNRCIEVGDDPVDYVAHIYNPLTKTERTVQTVTSNANCVVRLVWGAKCDILPSKVHQTDTSKYTTHFAAGFWLPASKGRVVLRSGSGADAGSGLACAGASVASSSSYTHSGGRLAFRGKFVIVG